MKGKREELRQEGKRGREMKRGAYRIKREDKN